MTIPRQFKQPETIQECDNYLNLVRIAKASNQDAENDELTLTAMDMLLDIRNELAKEDK